MVLWTTLVDLKHVLLLILDGSISITIVSWFDDNISMLDRFKKKIKFGNKKYKLIAYAINLY